MTKQLGPELVRRGMATHEEVESAATESRKVRRPMGEVMLDRGVVNERDLYRALAEVHELHRVVRRICEHCLAPVEPPADLVQEVFPDGVPEGMQFFKGTGCDYCRGTGCYSMVTPCARGCCRCATMR